MMVTREQGRELLRLARAELEAYFGVGASAEERESGEGDLLDLEASGPIGGVFVTLERDAVLRGCIGYLRSDAPVSTLTRRAVVSAAVEDPRFDRVTEDELSEVRITLTVLSPAVRLEEPEAVEVGRDGLIVERGGYRGLLLPVVAEKKGWSRERFLSETCRKAGLPAEAWKDPDTRVLRFEAESFEEKSPAGAA